MAKYTVLELVQDILASLNSDPVNSINDTPEALQVAQIVKSTYNELISNRNWPQEKRTFVLDSVGDTNYPTHLILPATVKELEALFYDQRRDVADKKQLKQIDYLDPVEFLDRTNARNESDSTVDLITDFGGIQFKIRNDIPPRYWTSFDDKYIVFDAYDSDVEATVQSANSQAIGYIEKAFVMADSHVPELPVDAFASLLAEAKAMAFLTLRQESNQRVEEIARRQRTWLSRKSWAAKGGIKTPDYGRKNKYNSGPTLPKN